MKTRISVVLALTVLVSLAMLPRQGAAAPAQNDLAAGPAQELEPRAWLAVVIGNYPPINHPPAAPYNPWPEDHSVVDQLSLTLTWLDEDPDGDTLTYDVYFAKWSIIGCNLNVAPVCQQIYEAQCPRSGLLRGSVYCWRVVAFDEHGLSTQGPMWVFTVKNLKAVSR